MSNKNLKVVSRLILMIKETQDLISKLKKKLNRKFIRNNKISMVSITKNDLIDLLCLKAFFKFLFN
jgi:hypothetical protein